MRLAARSSAAPNPEAPGLLLHHGLASSQRIWDLMLPRLVRGTRVVTYDARGHGRSGKPSSGYGFDHAAVDALAVIRAAKLRRPVFVGHSWGAMVGLHLAAGHPRSLAGLVLVDGGLAPLGALMDWKTTKERLAPPHLAGMPVDEFRSLIRMFFADAVDVTPDVEDIVLSVMHVDRSGRIRPNLSRANHFRILRAIWEQDPNALWTHLRVPALAIAAHRPDADDSERGFIEAKRRAVAHVRAATRGRPVRVEWMQGIHDLPLQHPEALARRIERFARGTVG